MSDEMKNILEDETKTEEVRSEEVKSEEIKVEKKDEKKNKSKYKKKKREKIDVVKWLKRIVTVGLLVLAVVLFSEGCGAVEEMDILPESMEFRRPEINASDGTDAGGENGESDAGDETDVSGVTQE